MHEMSINRLKPTYTLPTAIPSQQSRSRRAFFVAAEEVEGYASQEVEPENIHLATVFSMARPPGRSQQPYLFP